MVSHSMVMLLICQKTNHKKFQMNWSLWVEKDVYISLWKWILYVL